MTKHEQKIQDEVFELLAKFDDAAKLRIVRSVARFYGIDLDKAPDRCESCRGPLIDGQWSYDSAGEAKICAVCYHDLLLEKANAV